MTKRSMPPLLIRAAFEPPKVKRGEYDGPVERGPKGTTQVRGETGIHRSTRAGKSSAKIEVEKEE